MPIIRIRKTAIEGRVIPEFELNEGEVISLLVDSVESEFLLKDYLTGKMQHPDVVILQPILFIDYQPNLLSIWDKLMGRNLASQVVRRQLNCRDEKIIEILDKAQIGIDRTYQSLGVNPRRTLATLLAFEQGFNIIYTTAGMDPMGVEFFHQLVRNETKNRNVGSIELNIPFYSNDDWHREVPKVDKVIEIKRSGHNNRIKQAPFQLRKKWTT
ncbi:hypothetical protein D770_25655 [Flammeovirgaceae bacterium 311]|nr:hypothetical protein D770_25655 [Flammeovirgaceae bacterium 311]